jgi:hypothetical protein
MEREGERVRESGTGGRFKSVSRGSGGGQASKRVSEGPGARRAGRTAWPRDRGRVGRRGRELK